MDACCDRERTSIVTTVFRPIARVAPNLTTIGLISFFFRGGVVKLILSGGAHRESPKHTRK